MSRFHAGDRVLVTASEADKHEPWYKPGQIEATVEYHYTNGAVVVEIDGVHKVGFRPEEVKPMPKRRKAGAR